MEYTMHKPLLLDILEKGRFICQLKYDKRGFPEMIDGHIEEVYRLEDLEKFVLDKRPSLRGRDIRIKFSNQKA